MLVKTYLWDDDGLRLLVGEVYLDDRAALVDALGVQLPLSSAILLSGIPLVLASSVGVGPAPVLIWPGSNLRSTYNGAFLHDLRWFGLAERAAMNPTSAGAQIAASPGSDPAIDAAASQWGVAISAPLVVGGCALAGALLGAALAKGRGAWYGFALGAGAGVGVQALRES